MAFGGKSNNSKIGDIAKNNLSTSHDFCNCKQNFLLYGKSININIM